MAFDLNKSSDNNPTKKFDLSKTNPSAVIEAEKRKPRSQAWLLVFAGLIVISISAWYMLSSSDSSKKNDLITAGKADSDSSVSISLNQDKTGIKDVEKEGTVKNGHTDSGTGNSQPVSASAINNQVPATFVKGSPSISNMDKSLIDNIVSFLNNNTAAVITVNGYASSEGDLNVNQRISQARADAFKKFLVSKGINSGRINSIGRGIENPIGSNDSEEGRIKNRRVEISLQQ